MRTAIEADYGGSKWSTPLGLRFVEFYFAESVEQRLHAFQFGGKSEPSVSQAKKPLPFICVSRRFGEPLAVQDMLAALSRVARHRPSSPQQARISSLCLLRNLYLVIGELGEAGAQFLHQGHRKSLTLPSVTRWTFSNSRYGIGQAAMITHLR